ncbi:MAG TPA: PEGA domain-containing protein [Kofleriaceae bacterium]|nr:PEGA domain-containing protein [Kofleriaceae bacterium]
MATESSAIVRFISAAQQERHAIQDSSASLPEYTGDLEPITRRSHRVLIVVLGGLAFAAVAAAAGVFVGKHYFTPAEEADVAPPPAAARPAAVQAPRRAVASAPPAPAPAPVAASAAASTAAPVGSPAPAAASPAPAPAAQAPVATPAQLTPQVLAATGFDIRIKPQATINLDGRVLGKSPLRVRNLTPGAHVVDVEAPAGFFSRRVELDLNAGESQNVNLALDPIDPQDGAAAGTGAAEKAKPKAARAEKPARERRHAKRKPKRSHSHARRHRKQVAAVASLPDDASGDGDADGDDRGQKGESGTLLIGSKPPCDIYIDGEPTGLKTPQRAIELPPGSHRVTLINAELDIKKSFTVKISAGKSTRAIHDLTGKI